MREFAEKAHARVVAKYDATELELLHLGRKSKKARWSEQVLLLAPVVIATVDKFKEGINCPWMDSVVYAMARPGAAATEQSMNRATRVLEGKEYPLIVDFADKLANTDVLLRQQSKRRDLYRRRRLPQIRVPLTPADVIT